MEKLKPSSSQEESVEDQDSYTFALASYLPDQQDIPSGIHLLSPNELAPEDGRSDEEIAAQLKMGTPLSYHNQPDPISASLEDRTASPLNYEEDAEVAEESFVEEPSEPKPVWWQRLAALFILPVEAQADQDEEIAWVTWCTATLITMVSVLAFIDLSRHIGQFALVPADPFRLQGTTLVTYFFLHANLWHLVCNLYFLLVFGDNVERDLDAPLFLTVMLAATVFGALLHSSLSADSSVPLVGSSAAISAIVVYYALRFPKRKLAVLIVSRWIPISALYGLLLWLAIQSVGVVTQLFAFSTTSYIAHIGGALIGWLAWLARRPRLEDHLRSNHPSREMN